MTSPRTPQRLPEEVYVRRRVAAIGVIVVVVILFALLVPRFTGGFGEQNDAVATSLLSETTVVQTTSAEAESTSPEVASSSEAPGGIAASSSSAEPEPSPVIGEITHPEITQCGLEDLLVTASMDASDVPAGTQPHFYMTVHNPTNGECVINLDQEPLRFEVFTMDTADRLWGDIDCNVSEGRGQLQLAPGQQRSYEAVWSRTTSSPNSCANRQPVGPGSYVVVASVGNKASQAHPFTLRA